MTSKDGPTDRAGGSRREDDPSSSVSPGLTVHVQTGSLGGEVVGFDKDRVTVGRDPRSDLRFGPDTDLEVSTYHAVFARDENGWFLRDLGSRNGTWVDGERVTGDRPIRGGETVRFGAGGPRCRVEVAPTGSPAAGAAPGHPPPAEPTRPGLPFGEGVELSSHRSSRPRDPAASRARRLVAAVAALVVLLGLTVFAVLAASRQREAAWRRERTTLQARLDSALRASQKASGRAQQRTEGLADALAQSRQTIAQLRAELGRTRSASDQQVEALRQRLQAATAALQRQQIAASLDFDAIREKNWKAVAQLYVEFTDGTVVSGTAFAIRPNGTLVTARHMVVGEEGDQRPRRVAVQFAGSRQVWPARLVAIDRSVDIAVLRVENVVGSIPTVAGVRPPSDSIVSGQPVAILGFPLGGAEDPDSGGAGEPPRPLLSAGVLDRVRPGILDIQGYGERGASGSPIFDADGDVVGVLYGGRVDDEGVRRLVGVPADVLTDLLDRIP